MTQVGPKSHIALLLRCLAAADLICSAVFKNDKWIIIDERRRVSMVYVSTFPKIL